MSGERPVLCQDCGSPLAPSQRYCLECGARVGEPSGLLLALLARIEPPASTPTVHPAGRVHPAGASAGAGAGADGASAGAPPVGDAPASAPRPAVGDAPASASGPKLRDVPASATRPADIRTRSWVTALSLPRPRISALLVLAFLGFGLLLGNVASSPPRDALAASARQQLKLVLPASVVAATTAPGAAPSSSHSEPPPAEPQATPEPTPAPATTPAKKTAGKAGSGVSGSKGGEGGSGESAAGKPSKTLPAAIKHVFVIVLSGQPYAALFGPESAATYLAHTLEARGVLLARYDAVAHQQLANEIALVSGQGPTAEIAANCATYANIAPATPAADEQLLGNGCVYPSSTQTLAGQLTAKHLSWRAYAQSSDETGASAAACAHPALGAADPTSAQSAGAYATSVNPFLYFHSIIDTSACAANDVRLSQLKVDLASLATTPSFSYIAPDRCHDANPTPCTPSAPAGVAPADAFLQQVVPEITASKAYKQGGLLVITVDNAPSSGEYADSSSCCGQPQFPNLPTASTGLSPRGGGTVGALLLSPFVKRGAIDQEPFNHFSLLRTIEDLFGLQHLGYAALPTVRSFPPAMFTGGKG